jgi:hypothetical protein
MKKLIDATTQALCRRVVTARAGLRQIPWPIQVYDAAIFTTLIWLLAVKL